MIPVHPFPASFGWIFYASMVPTLLIFGSIYYFFLRNKKTLFFGLLFFTFNIMFLLQVLGAGVGFIADRFTYIAYFGLFFIYAIGLQWILEKHKKYSKLIYLTTLIILGVFGYMNFEQNKIWKNGETLWSHEIKYYDQIPFAWHQRATYYSKEARYEEALHDYSKSIQYSPDSRKSSSFVDRGITYTKLKMYNRALQDFNAAESLGSTSDMMYYYRSLININRKKYDKAQSDIEKYLRSNPDDLFMRSNLRMITSMQDRYKTIE
jgi:tetratricopeptide (TPR) repeat protein